MSNVSRDLLWRVCLCYLDDIIIYARTPQELLERLRIVLDRLRDVGLKEGEAYQMCSVQNGNLLSWPSSFGAWHLTLVRQN